MRIIKIDGATGKVIWQNQLSKKFILNLIDCTIGELVESGSYWLVLNFRSMEEITKNLKYQSKAQGINAPYNVAIIQIDRLGFAYKISPKLSDGPLLVNYCEVDESGNIFLQGRRGNYDIVHGLNPADRADLR